VTIQDLGNIGELVAALATVFTLAYLALQIRLNTRALDQALERGSVEDAGRWRDKVIQSQDVANLYLKGLREPESLDQTEKFRFRMLMEELFLHWHYEYKTRPHSRQGQAPFVAPVLSTPGGAQSWQRSKPLFSSEFIEHIDRAVNAKEADRAASAT